MILGSLIMVVTSRDEITHAVDCMCLSSDSAEPPRSSRSCRLLTPAIPVGAGVLA